MIVLIYYNIKMMHVCDNECLEILCPNCKTNHAQNFESSFDSHAHYREIICAECGYKIIIKDKNFYSGSQIDKIINALESKIKDQVPLDNIDLGSRVVRTINDL